MAFWFARWMFWWMFWRGFYVSALSAVLADRANPETDRAIQPLSAHAAADHGTHQSE